MELKDYTIGIIGFGTVGSALASAYREHVKEVRVWDRDPIKCPGALWTPQDVLDSDLCFLCLPTPQKTGSLECDTRQIEYVLDASTISHRQANLVLKSTVPVGFTRTMAEKYNLPNLVHSPEFLTARTAERDARNPMVQIIGQTRNLVAGGPNSNSCYWMLHNFYTLLEEYRNECSPAPPQPVLDMTSDESEMVKHLVNAFYAIKVATFNEFRSFSDAKGTDWDVVLNAMLSLGTINSSHTQVPGPDGRYGFGGACLTKDLASLVSQMWKGHISAKMCIAAQERNTTDRTNDGNKFDPSKEVK